jgi:non-heme Fe2+,alpha-ketoglutarate-dependent halogenase
MPNVLTQAQIDFFKTEGYLTGLPAMSSSEAQRHRQALEAFEQRTGTPASALEQKAHLYFGWTWALCRSQPLLGIIQDLLGPNVLIFASRFWTKEPEDRKFVSWHQDMAYFELDPQEMITAWIGITDATQENGAMKFIPRSHASLRQHTETSDKNNLLSRGQSVTDVNEADAIDATLKAGEFSVHHGNLLHHSPANRSNDRRIGFSLMMFPTHLKSTAERRPATLLCGEERYNYWDHDPLPTRDEDPVIWELMRKVDQRYRGTQITQAAQARA